MTMYISIDVETNGPCPGVHSMLQLGAAAFDEYGRLVESISYTLNLLEGAVADPNTMRWWITENKAAYESTRTCCYDPSEVMPNFASWVKKFHRPTAVAYPAGFDFPWVYYYCCLDIKSYAAAVLNVPYREATKKHMPKEWFQGLPKHTHDAADDAIEQGYLFFRILEAGRKK